LLDPLRLEPGTRLGHYDIVGLLGAGGMGAVYKAKDSRLDRYVAIKVLKHVSPELRQRFEREARVISALQHPRICMLIDIGVHDGTDYIVMEYLEGRTLTCPQPIGKAIEYGMQIADALDAAHTKGITHRDLKPDNVLVTPNGIKLLDFGIAKAAGLETVTVTGAAVGTPAYMAPEQWRGETTDHRTDIYALGCVLHEMADGQKAKDTPLGHHRLEWIVRGCLAREPDDRWQSARDVKRLLQSIGEPGTEPVAAARRSWLLPAVVTLLGLAGMAAAWMLRPAPPRALYQLSIAPPANGTLLIARNREGGIAVAPDGSAIAFSANVGGRIQLWIRRLDLPEAQPMPGTDGAFYPFWSPDSRWIAYFTPGKLMRVAADGGTPQTISVNEPRSLGGAWGAGDVILITTDGASLNRVNAVGGTLAPVTAGRWPHFLPDGTRFLYDHEGGIWVASIAGGEAPRRILETNAVKPAYSNGHLLFIRDQALHAQRFNAATLELSGDAFPISPTMSGNASDNPGDFSVTAAGLLAYGTGQRLIALAWRDRSGKRLGDLASGAELVTPRISPDGKRVAFARVDGNNTDIWIADRDGHAPTRLTFDPATDRWPIWSPDGRTITYSSGTLRDYDLFRRAADGSGVAERLTNQLSAQHPMDWSPDNRYLSFTRNERGYGTDLLVLTPDRKTHTFLKTTVSEAHSQIDPKSGTWIAYSSDDSGRREIYVKPFTPRQPASDARWQISTAGGTMPRWRRDGKELFYWGLDGRIMASEVDGTGKAFKWSTPVVLFEAGAPTLRTNDINFDVTPDGQRLLIVEPAERSGSEPLMVVTDWLAATRAK
jgi:Tol biopolymer transport system component/predicted Ser/Thr protein kinase